jgi:hypothetical protein
LQENTLYGNLIALMINISIAKNNNENDINLLRRFTRKVRSSGILPRIRSIRYHSRPLSPLTKKLKILKSIEHRTKREKLIKLGKLEERKTR